MTHEEAALILHPDTSREALLPYTYDPDQRLKVVEEACRIGAEAIRAQRELLELVRGDCNYCKYRGRSIDDPCKGCAHFAAREFIQGDHWELIGALQQAEEKNDPLTLEELRVALATANGGSIPRCHLDAQPIVVWIAFLDVDGKTDVADGEWEAFNGEEFYGPNEYSDTEEYGKTFVAYRRPPEKEEESINGN